VCGTKNILEKSSDQNLHELKGYNAYLFVLLVFNGTFSTNIGP